MDEGRGMRFCLNKGTVPFVTCTDLEDIRLSEINQAQRHKWRMMSSVCGGGGTGEQWGCVAQGSESSKGNNPQMRNGMFKTSRPSGLED